MNMTTTSVIILLCIIAGALYYYYKPSQFLETFQAKRAKKRAKRVKRVKRAKRAKRASRRRPRKSLAGDAYLKQQRHEAHVLGGKMALQLMPGRHWLSPSKPLRFQANHLPKHRSGAYSIYFWTKFTPATAATTADKKSFLLRHGAANEEEEISLLAQAPHTLFVRNRSTAFAFPTRRWTHVALIKTHTRRLRVYINGKLITEEEPRGASATGGGLIFGGGGFRGWVSHVEYANYALSRSELAAVLNGGPLQAAITHLRTAFAQVGCTANPVPDVGNPYSDQWNNRWLAQAPKALTQSLAQFKTQADRAVVAKQPDAANVIKYAEKCYGRVDALNRVKLSKAMNTVSHDYKVIQHQLNRITRQLAEIRRLKKLLAVCQSHAKKIAQVQATLQLKKNNMPHLQNKLKNELAATQQMHHRDTQKLQQALLAATPAGTTQHKSLDQIQHSIDRNIADIGTQINTINRTIGGGSNKMSSAEMANLSNRIAVLRQNNLRG